MSTLDDLFGEVLRAELTFPNLGLRLIADSFSEIGITLTRQQRAAILDRLSMVGETDFADFQVNITKAQLARSRLTPEQRAASGTLQLDLGVDAFLTKLKDEIPDIVMGVVASASGLVLRKLKRGASRLRREHRAERGGFETRLAKRLGPALDLLEMFCVLALEAGDEFNREFRDDAARSNNFVFEVLTRLHARACQAASEILALLRTGHADGAHARWRLLHEIAVTGSVISARGDDVAERYILHQVIESARAARLYQAHYAALGAEPLSAGELARIERAAASLRTRFGPEYGNRYGWAATEMTKDPTFLDLEKAAGLDHLRPYYKLASHNVHAEPTSAFVRLGLLRDTMLLLAGPSDVGLADPGHSTAISLGQITTTLLMTRVSFERLVMCQILLLLVDEIGDVFLSCHEKLVARGGSGRY